MLSMKQISASAFISLILLAAIPFEAKAQQPLQLEYAVYAGGIYVLDAAIGLDDDEKNKTYTLSVAAQTHGFINRLFPWRGTFKTSGVEKQGRYIPLDHTATSTWRREVKTTQITFDPQGRFETITTEESGRTQTRKAARDIADGAHDMMTALLSVLDSAQEHQACNAVIPVFDGKRRFDIILKRGEWDEISASRYSIYSGRALRCEVEVKPIAGFRKRDMRRGWIAVQEHSRQRNKMPTLWLAHGPQGVMVPVRMEISSGFGAVIAHLRVVEPEKALKAFKDNRKNQP